MIVPMKKIHIIVQAKDIVSALENLRQVGTVHVEHQENLAGEKIEILKLKTFLPKIQLSLHQFHNRELIQNTLPIFLGEKVIF